MPLIRLGVSGSRWGHPLLLRNFSRLVQHKITRIACTWKCNTRYLKVQIRVQDIQELCVYVCVVKNPWAKLYFVETEWIFRRKCSPCVSVGNRIVPRWRFGGFALWTNIDESSQIVSKKQYSSPNRYDCDRTMVDVQPTLASTLTESRSQNSIYIFTRGKNTLQILHCALYQVAWHNYIYKALAFLVWITLLGVIRIHF